MQIEIHSNDAGPELWISYVDGENDADSWNARALVQNFLGNDLQIVGCHSELTRNWIIRVRPEPQPLRRELDQPFGRPDPPASARWPTMANLLFIGVLIGAAISLSNPFIFPSLQMITVRIVLIILIAAFLYLNFQIRRGFRRG